MKHLKLFEELDREPKKGDWVIIKASEPDWADWAINYVNNSTFKIINVREHVSTKYTINLEKGVGNVEKLKLKGIDGVKRNEILHFGKKKDMLFILETMKYNL